MPYVLPKEAKTQSLSSLPDDLRKIAEELIGEKFKVEEVVERKSRPRFQGVNPEDVFIDPRRRSTAFYEQASKYGGRFSIEDDVRTRSRIARAIISSPDLEGIANARNVILEHCGSARVREMTLYLTDYAWAHIRSMPEISMYIASDYSTSSGKPRLAGMNVEITYSSPEAYIEARIY